MLSALPIAPNLPYTQYNPWVDSILVGLDIRRQKTRQTGQVEHVGEECNSPSRKGCILPPARTPRVRDIGGAGLKWADKGCSMGSMGEGTKGIPANKQRVLGT